MFDLLLFLLIFFILILLNLQIKWIYLLNTVLGMDSKYFIWLRLPFNQFGSVVNCRVLLIYHCWKKLWSKTFWEYELLVGIYTTYLTVRLFSFWFFILIIKQLLYNFIWWYLGNLVFMANNWRCPTSSLSHIQCFLLICLYPFSSSSTSR